MLTRREAAVAAVATLAAQVADALPAAATAIQPPGSPRPLPPERKVKISNVVATAPLGVPIDVPTSGWLPNEKILWSVLRNNAPASTWRTNPPSSAIADAKGNAIIKATFVANADFLRVMTADRSVHQDSVTVATKPPAPAPSGDAAFSFAFRDALRHGVNFERWRPVYMNFRGHPTASSPAYYQ
jgi:hypothetical protein